MTGFGALDLTEHRASGTPVSRQREQIDDIANRAVVAAGDAELVAATDAEQEIPAPFKIQRWLRYQDDVGFERFAKAVTEPDVAVEIRLGLTVAAQQSIGDQQIGQYTRLQCALRAAY